MSNALKKTKCKWSVEKATAKATPKASTQPPKATKRDQGDQAPQGQPMKRVRVNAKMREQPKQASGVPTITPNQCPPHWLLCKALQGMDNRKTGATPKITRKGVIGEGSFGVVYSGWSPEHGGNVVLKSQKERDWYQFLSEVDLMGKLKHPNIMNLLDIDTSDSLTLIMPWGGLSLAEVLRALINVRFTRDPVRKWQNHAEQLLRAIAYLHDNDVIHSDLKPANIVVDASGLLRLIDLGCAIVDIAGCRVTKRPSLEVQRDGLCYGTFWYRSIELFLGDESFGKPIDVWAAGCVVFELIRHSVLFQHRRANEMIEHMLSTIGPLRGTAFEYCAQLPAYRPWMSKVSGDGKKTFQANLKQSVSESDAKWISEFFCLHPWLRPTAHELLRTCPTEEACPENKADTA